MGIDRVALVTGAGRGIGAEVARQLAQSGYQVLAAVRDVSTAQSVCDAIAADGGHTVVVQLDLDDPNSIETIAETLRDRPLDLLVNNAAAFADWSETASSTDLWRAREIMETNLFGTWHLIQATLPALRRATDARIVNVGSGSGSHGDPAFGLATNPVAASYAISKAALHALTVKLAVELAPEGICVTAVDPGLTATAPGMEAMGARPVADGAASVVTAALRPASEVAAILTRDGLVLPW